MNLLFLLFDHDNFMFLSLLASDEIFYYKNFLIYGTHTHGYGVFCYIAIQQNNCPGGPF